MSDLFETLDEMRAQMEALWRAWETGYWLGAKDCLRRMHDAHGGGAARFADYTDDELREAIRVAAKTRDADRDATKAETALRELHDMRAEMMRRAFPHGMDYAAPPAMCIADIDATPPPVLLRTDGNRDAAVLVAGEVCVLSGAGGAGKSTLALAVAYAVAAGGKHDSTACGLELINDDKDGPQARPVVYASAEDAAWQIKRAAWRMAAARGDDALPANLHHVDLRGRMLFAPAADGYNAPAVTTPEWESLWDYVAAARAKLVVIDPVMAVYAGNENRAVEVRQFIGALTAQAEAHGCGVLLLAHSTKAARGAKADAFDPGHVAGSASWTDGVRGAMALDWPRDGDGGGAEDMRVLKIIKANYGQPRIQCALTPVRENAAKGLRAIVGFDAGVWESPRETGGAPRGKNNGGSRRAAADDDLRPAI